MIYLEALNIFVLVYNHKTRVEESILNRCRKTNKAQSCEHNMHNAFKFGSQSFGGLGFGLVLGLIILMTLSSVCVSFIRTQ